MGMGTHVMHVSSLLTKIYIVVLGWIGVVRKQNETETSLTRLYALSPSTAFAHILTFDLGVELKTVIDVHLGHGPFCVLLLGLLFPLLVCLWINTSCTSN